MPFTGMNEIQRNSSAETAESNKKKTNKKHNNK